VAVESSCWT